MCQFCTLHGDGKKWYLQAANYAFDLERDLARRGFMLEFARDFDSKAARAVRWLAMLDAAPAPVRRFASERATRALKQSHFGQPVPIEDCARIFDITTSIARLPCVCRRFASGKEQAYCLLLTTRPIVDASCDPFMRDLAEALLRDYGAGPDVAGFELFSKEGALAMLRECEHEGLMHSVWTFITPFIAAMCNCNLDSGCMAMRFTREFDCKVMHKGEYVAVVDSQRCTGCRACLDRCPFDALDIDAHLGKAQVRSLDCYGCGVCRAGCDADALALHERREVAAVAASW